MSYLLNLLFLMIHSGIEDLQYSNYHKVLMGVYEKFMPGLSSEQIDKALK